MFAPAAPETTLTRLRDHAHAIDQPLTQLARRLVTRQAGAEVLRLTEH